jgi:putative inorganic carbon (HCO3(-)) transporter
VAAHPQRLRLGPPALPELSSGVLVAAGACILSAAVTSLLVVSVTLGVALLAGVLFLLVALRNVPLATAGWIVLVYIAGLPGFEALPNRTLYVVLLCWIGAVAGLKARGASAFGAGRAIVALVVLFLTWQAVSLVWAPVPSDGQALFKDYFVLGAGFLVVLSSVRTRRHVRWIAAAFVVGAALSVLGGIVNGGLTSAQLGGDTSTSRFAGAGGDPNYLAAMLIPAIMLAGGLAVRASVALRAALIGSVLVMAVGMAATQSRGGLVALAVTMLAAFVVLRGRRLTVVALVLATLCGATVFFVSNPAAWQRIHAVSDGGSGSGRTDIWHVAWRVAQSHPIAGVGLAQFPNVSPQYAREPGALSYVGLIVDDHIVVHNVYLELWAETGIVGLLTFLAVAGAALLATRRAARLFDGLDDAEMAALARAVLLALIGVLVGSFFLSNILARQIWVLFALGPALLVVARREAAATASALTVPGD